MPDGNATDLDRLVKAVAAMRAAQKLEYAALPSNFRHWKNARTKMEISRLEHAVDELLEAISSASRR